MTKPKEDIETEEIIKRTAKKLFFEEGKFNATTQEIADAAGVNRTLINYYFRSRNNLFDIIFNDAIKREEFLRHKLLSSDLPFNQKVELYIEESIEQAIEFPYLETYIVSKINEGLFYDDERDWDGFYETFYKEFEIEVKKGNIHETDPVQFILNIASLISFPFAIRPLFQRMMKLNDEAFDEIISQRKEVIMKTLFKK